MNQIDIFFNQNEKEITNDKNLDKNTLIETEYYHTSFSSNESNLSFTKYLYKVEEYIPIEEIQNIMTYLKIMIKI